MLKNTEPQLAWLYEHLGGITILEMTFQAFLFLAENANSLTTCYSTWTIPKKNGKARLIEAPIEDLKRVQRALIPLFSRFPIPDHVYGLGGKEKDACANAEQHIGQKVIVQMDIKDFFPSTSLQAVQWAMKTFNTTYTDLMLIGLQFCFVVDQNGETRLPMGAPTSPILANIAFTTVDRFIKLYATSVGIKYTRYMDDLTFSSNSYPEGLQKNVNNIVREYSEYCMNHNKSTVSYQGNDRQVVTGVCVNRSKSVGRQFKKKLRAELDHHARTHLMLSPYLQGKLAYLQRINPKQYTKFMAYWYGRNSFYCHNLLTQIV